MITIYQDSLSPYYLPLYPGQQSHTIARGRIKGAVSPTFTGQLILTIKTQVVKAQLLVRTNCRPVTIPGTVGSRGPTVYVDFIEFYRILSMGQHSPAFNFPGLTQSNSPGQHRPALNFPGLTQSNSPGQHSPASIFPGLTQSNSLGQHSPVHTSWTHQSIN